MALLDIDQLSVDIPTDSGCLHVVRNLCLKLEKGESLGIVGESGSGKSMTALALMRLLPVSAVCRSHRLKFNDTELTSLSNSDFAKNIQGKRIGMIFQEPMTSLNPVYTIGRQMVEASVRDRLTSHGQAKEKAIALLERVGINEPALRFNQYPHQLSGGQRQRVMIAMALMLEPDILIADEPTTALDVSVQAQILELLHDIRRDFGMGLIFISHDLAVVSSTTDRVMVMYGGEVIEQGPSHQLLRQPAHPYTRALLDAIPRIEGPKTRLGTIEGLVPSPNQVPQGCIFAQRCSFAKELCHTQKPNATVNDTHEVYCHFISELGPHRRVTPRILETHSSQHSDIALEAIDVCQTYRLKTGLFQPDREIRAVDHVSLKIYRGETMALVGESGSGKSSLARILLGLAAPTSGDVRLMGQPVSAYDGMERAHLIQPIFQDPYSSLNPRHTIFEIIARPLMLQSVPNEQQIERVHEMLDLVRLPQTLIHRYPQQLSGGQRQRVAIARAMISRPEILVCDEPTSALDVSVQAQILNLIADLQAQFDLTTVLITHDMAVVNQLADRVAVLLRGQLVELGSADTVLHNPQSTYTQSLIASAPRFEPFTALIRNNQDAVLSI